MVNAFNGEEGTYRLFSRRGEYSFGKPGTTTVSKKHVPWLALVGTYESVKPFHTTIYTFTVFPLDIIRITGFYAKFYTVRTNGLGNDSEIINISGTCTCFLPNGNFFGE